jgi:glucokinase
MRILSADVGGTKALVRISTLDSSGVRVEREERYESADHTSLGEMVTRFLADEREAVVAACLAVAGPADGRNARVTNLGWRDSSAELERLSGIPRVRLVNDFYAVAAGIPRLGPDDLVPINPRARDPHGPMAILGAGTGLGEAVSVNVAGRQKILSSEGGHSSFAPRSHVQRMLLDFLEERHGHVSYERILSGPGIVNIFTYFCERVFHVTPADAGVPDSEPHKAARIASLADDGHDIASRTIETFVDIYGAEAGNLALKVLPSGGVYVCGGIAAKNLHWFQGERFLAAYADKGRMRELLLAFPVDVASNAKLGLIGATAIAEEMARGGAGSE